MTEFSPQTQAVLDAWESKLEPMVTCLTHDPEREALAAALRAAADQVMSPVPPPCKDFDEYAQGFLAAHVKYRSKLLAIASELRGTTTTMETP